MRCCFIINPNSRSQRGRAIWEEVQKELEKSQIKYDLSDGTEKKCDSDRSDAYG